ncbi:PREDICTED: VWFA and cache domain-containing protein 1-like [Priapulus caudatus]|uniref:VWFA and cache domain-containing protein 1-like n=1 Tax=Priapulus caudatus TaxID=37621 RepID=A0ABM1EVU9_PRICU|nr:PREDICTED: VWFA and cache domain-containing protein 1-like [Priapulus caudatus]
MLSPLAPSAGDFLYHRLDLIQSQVDTSQCRYFGNIAIKDRSTVKFAPDAFVDPYHYLDSNESNVTVRQYSQYMNDVTTFATNPGFKDGVRDDVVATMRAEVLWRESGLEKLHTRIPWRYIGTARGVFRQLPGTSSNKLYNPPQRPWYLRAMSNPGKLTISAPYRDALAADVGYVVTLSHTIVQPAKSRGNTGVATVSAVMGADYTLSHFYSLLAMNDACNGKSAIAKKYDTRLAVWSNVGPTISDIHGDCYGCRHECSDSQVRADEFDLDLDRIHRQ